MKLSFRNSKFGPFRKYYGLRTSELPLAKLPYHLTISFSAITQYLPHAQKYISQTVTNFLLLSAENTNKHRDF